MTASFDIARRALSARYRSDTEEADSQYAQFLDALIAMKPRCSEVGIFFELEEGTTPTEIYFTTGSGTVVMERLMTLHDDKVGYAVVFSALPLPGYVRLPDLWSLQLHWNAPWKHSDGQTVSRDPMTDQVDQYAAFEAVRSAAATLLLLNTERLERS